MLPSHSRLLLVLALLAATGARAEVEFVGVLVTSARSMFALSEDATKPATWRALGQDFAGYKLTEFDAKADTLVLMRDGAPLRLHLKDDAKVESARIEIAGALRLGAGPKLEINRATLVFDQENVFPLTDGLVVRITPTRRPDGNILYRAAFERPGPDGRPEKLSLPSVITLPAGSFNVQVGDIGFGFTPKSG